MFASECTEVGGVVIPQSMILEYILASIERLRVTVILRKMLSPLEDLVILSLRLRLFYRSHSPLWLQRRLWKR